jgi:glycosyltransferase involved in cell wall biosynthesis
LKILHINGYLSGGGVEQYLDQLFVELDRIGHTNFLLYGCNSQFKNNLSKVKTFFIENITNINCDNQQAKLEAVQKILDSHNPDLVYVHQIHNYHLLDLLAQQRPTIRFVHDFKVVCPDGRKTLKTTKSVCSFPLSYKCKLHAYRFRCMPRNPFIGLPLIKNCHNIANVHKTKSTIVVASDFMKSVLIRNGFSECKIHVIPYFTYLPARRNASLVNQEPMILAVGRITQEKGMDHILRAFASIPVALKLVIVGDGPSLKSLKDLASELRINSKVTFAGWLAHEKLHELYQQADMVVVPSIWPEPFGIVGIEAMAHGRPVLAYDVGGICQWLDDGCTGILVKRGDEKALVEKIVYLLQNPDLAERMGQAGRRRVEKYFVPEAHVKPLVALFEGATKDFIQH